MGPGDGCFSLDETIVTITDLQIKAIGVKLALREVMLIAPAVVFLPNNVP